MDINRVFLRVLEKTNCKCFICQGKSETPKEIAGHRYRPMDAEGQYQDEYVSVFDLRETKFASFNDAGRVHVSVLRYKFDQFGRWNVENGVAALTGIRPIYRRCPVNWGELEYMQMPCARRPGGDKQIGYSEHSVAAMATEDDFADCQRYNSVILRNAKFAFFKQNMYLQAAIMGMYKNPFIRDNSKSEWVNNWDFIENSRCSLAEWIKVLNFEANSEVLAFIAYFKTAVRKYATDLKLEDSRHWERANEEGVYIAHLLMWIKMTNTSFNICYHALTTVWTHLVKTQMDMGRLIEMMINK